MKASQITTRNRKSKPVIKSLAAVAVLTFFVAGPTEASCKNQRIRARYNNSHASSQVQTAHNNQDIYQDLYTIPRIEVLRDGHENSNERLGRHNQYGATDLRGITPMYGNTTIPIDNTPRWRKKEEERILRERVIKGLKDAGVIREPGQPATTTKKPGSGTGTTTTKPKPKPQPTPKPTPKPKVTKLPNGDQITEYPDGRREIKMKNGDTVTTHKNGKRVIKNAKGDTTETHPSGYRKTTNRYGDGTAHFADGTRIDFKSSGEATLTTKHGQKFHREPGKGFKPVD